MIRTKQQMRNVFRMTFMGSYETNQKSAASVILPWGCPQGSNSTDTNTVQLPDAAEQPKRNPVQQAKCNCKCPFH